MQRHETFACVSHSAINPQLLNSTDNSDAEEADATHHSDSGFDSNSDSDDSDSTSGDSGSTSGDSDSTTDDVTYIQIHQRDFKYHLQGCPELIVSAGRIWDASTLTQIAYHPFCEMFYYHWIPNDQGA